MPKLKAQIIVRVPVNITVLEIHRDHVAIEVETPAGRETETMGVGQTFALGVVIVSPEGGEGQPRPSILCPVCGRRSHHPSDVQEGYCGACHAFTGRPCDLEPDGFRPGVAACPVCGWPPGKHPHA